MSDFQDFLKHKFAHVAIGEFKPGKFAEAQQLYEQAVATYHHGFQGAYLLREGESDRGISIIFWESVDVMDDQDNHNEVYQSILKKMAPLFATPPRTAIYEVVSELTPTELHPVNQN